MRTTRSRRSSYFVSTAISFGTQSNTNPVSTQTLPRSPKGLLVCKHISPSGVLRTPKSCVSSLEMLAVDFSAKSSGHRLSPARHEESGLGSTSHNRIGCSFGASTTMYWMPSEARGIFRWFHPWQLHLMDRLPLQHLLEKLVSMAAGVWRDAKLQRDHFQAQLSTNEQNAGVG